MLSEIHGRLGFIPLESHHADIIPALATTV